MCVCACVVVDVAMMKLTVHLEKGRKADASERCSAQRSTSPPPRGQRWTLWRAKSIRFKLERKWLTFEDNKESF